MEAKFAKTNSSTIKSGKKPEAKAILQRWLSKLQGNVKGLTGYAILDSLNDKELVVVTFWETKQDMDSFYTPNNPLLLEHVKESESVREKLPDRRDYEVAALVA